MPYLKKKKLPNSKWKNKRYDYLRSKTYNTSRWRRLSKAKKTESPLCEKCKRAFVQQVHHITPWLRGATDDEKLELFFDYDNLMSLCKKCHDEMHGKKEDDKMKGL